MNGKLLFLDIDGTLTEPGYNVPPASALEAIKKAQKNGHRVFLCSGRNLAMLKPLLSYGFDGYVASSGGYVVCDGTVVFDRPMKPEVFELAIGIGKLCEFLGKDIISDAIGFGDSMNDKEMFEAVGYSVCMDNGHPDMKAMADYVCPAVGDDGLYKAFEHLGLI